MLSSSNGPPAPPSVSGKPKLKRKRSPSPPPGSPPGPPPASGSAVAPLHRTPPAIPLKVAMASFDLRPGKPHRPRESVLFSHMRKAWQTNCHLLMFSGCSCRYLFLQEHGSDRDERVQATSFKEPAALFPLLRRIEREGLGIRAAASNLSSAPATTTRPLGLFVVIEGGYNLVPEGGRGPSGLHGPMFWHVWIEESLPGARITSGTGTTPEAPGALRVQIRYSGFQYFWTGAQCGMSAEKYLDQFNNGEEGEIVLGDWAQQFQGSSAGSGGSAAAAGGAGAGGDIEDGRAEYKQNITMVCITSHLHISSLSARTSTPNIHQHIDCAVV